MKKKYILIAYFMFALLALKAQELSTIGKNNPFAISGSIGAATDYYASNEQIQSRPKFAWSVNGSINPSIYGISFPMSFVINQSSRSYSTPFTQLGITPSYKWIKLYLGYRSMHFSPYTFDGQTFLGVGLELTPKIFRFSAFYGIINKAIQSDTSLLNYHSDQYKRRAWAIKLGAGNATNFFDLIYFHAKDDSNSIRATGPLSVRPEENHVFGLSFRVTVKKIFFISGDAAASLLNSDLAFQKVDSGEYPNRTVRNLINVFNVSYASEAGFCGKVTLGLNLKKVNLSISYQRIWPGFSSLGIPYLQNDVEALMGTVGFSLAKGKVNINLNVNGQHNDLDHNLATETRTLVGNLNISTLISKHFTCTWNASGTYLKQEDGAATVSDSFRLNQLILNGSVNPSYNFQKNDISHTISLGLNTTTVDNFNAFYASTNNSYTFSSTLGYNSFFSKKGLSFNCSGNYNRYISALSKSQSAGIHVGFSLQLLKAKNLSLQGNTGYIENIFNPGGDRANVTVSLSSSYRFFKQHAISAYINSVVTPAGKVSPENSYTVTSNNLAIGLAYSYNFSYASKSKLK